MFDLLKTGIDGLDAVLGGGVRYPQGTAAFMFITGGPGSGKTLLALETVTRAWLGGEDGSTCLYYSVEQSPDNLHKKLESDFEFYGLAGDVSVLEREVPNKLCLEATTARGRTRLVLTQANPASLESTDRGAPVVDVEWIIAEIGNYRLAGGVNMVCIDNVGLLLTDLDYFAKRQKLLASRHVLMSQSIHGIFVQEESDPRDLRVPSAEEFSTDLLIRLSFLEQPGGFKARSLEIHKARHQYYYRGVQHFSIAGRGSVARLLGARSERGPGIHIYPSVAAQLSIARDRSELVVPKRGSEPIDLGHPDLAAPFLHGTGPTAGSSSVLLAEPGTRYTYLALRFLAAGQRRDEPTLLISTKEDPDALARVCAREPELEPHCLGEDGNFKDRFRILYLHPEYISPGKLTWDALRAAAGEGRQPPAVRLAFDNVFQLQDRFPLVDNQSFLVSALLDLLRYRGITPLFVDLVPPGSAHGRVDFDPSRYMTTFDNVFHLYLERHGDEHRPFLRVLKSTASDFKHSPRPVDYRRA
ncbi:MAG: ATPase domain-containing protein [Planctomycetota bacterium]